MTGLLDWLTCASALVVAAACSSGPASPDTHDGAGGEPGASGAGTGGTAGSGSAQPSCPEGDNPKTDTKPVLVGLVSGQIVDEHGDPTSDFTDAAAFTPGTAVTSGGVTLTLAPNAHVDVVDALNYEESQRGFRAVQLPEKAVAQLAQDFVAAWALSPVETRICPSPGLSLENTTELAPGTPIELFMLGVDVLEKWAPYGGWQRVSEGEVGADGATLDFPDGPPLLTAIGVREKR